MATVSRKIQMCAVTSHPMGCFSWDSHRNDIPVDKPVFLIYAPNHNRFVSKVAGFTFRVLDLGI